MDEPDNKENHDAVPLKTKMLNYRAPERYVAVKIDFGTLG